MTVPRTILIITAIIEETPDTRSFVLAHAAGPPLSYRAGQFLTFVFKTPFGEQRRNYSISSAPGTGEPLTITVKRISNGMFSRLLVDNAAIGDQLVSIGASGLFTLPEKRFPVLCLFAAGSGITPVFSLIKAILHMDLDTRVLLIYSNRDRQHCIFRQALLTLAERFPARLQIEWLFSDLMDHNKARLSNGLLIKLLGRYEVQPASTLFYSCGPHLYMQMIRISLLSSGVPITNIRKEEFTTPPLHHRALPPDRVTHEARISFQGKEFAFPVTYPDSILQSAKRAHIELPYSCETGRCGTCAAHCLSGQVWMAQNEVLTDADIAAGSVLTCRGHPVGGNIYLRI